MMTIAQHFLTTCSEPSIVMITGASGSGKTTLLQALEQKTSGVGISFHHFDDIGVPTFEEMIEKWGSPPQWQEWATRTWVERLAGEKEKKLVFLEGSFNPDFAFKKMKELGLKNVILMCLHADREVRDRRLIEERNQPELATQDMENFAQVLKSKTIQAGGIVINSGHRAPSDLAEEVLDLIESEKLNFIIRPAVPADIKEMVGLSYDKRRAYEKVQPQFWRYAEGAEQSQAEWFETLLSRQDHIVLCAVFEEKIKGFIIGNLVKASEVYDPGGLTLMIDDFCVESSFCWESMGLQLLTACKALAKTKGAGQVVVVAGAHDEAKRQFLKNQKLTIASEWYVGELIRS